MASFHSFYILYKLRRKRNSLSNSCSISELSQIGRSTTAGFYNAYLFHSMLIPFSSNASTSLLSLCVESFFHVTAKIHSHKLRRNQKQTTVAKITHQASYSNETIGSSWNGICAPSVQLTATPTAIALQTGVGC